MSSPRPRIRWNAAFFLALALLAPRTARADDAACGALLQQATVVLNEAEQQHEKGNAAAAARRAVDALGIVDRAYSLCPRNRDVCALGVIGAVYADRWEVGRQWLDRYAGLTPYGERDPQLHYLRALVEARLVRRPDLAIRSLERMQALAPYLFPMQRDTLYYEALMNHGNALKRALQYEDAIKHFQTAALVARRAGKPAKARGARVNIAITHLQASRFQEAADLWTELRKEEPNNPIWSYQQGLSLANLSRFQEAIEAYRHSIANQPTFEATADVKAEIQRARLRLGNCLKLRSIQAADPVQRKKLLAEGQRELEAYVKDQPKDPLGHLWLGVLLYDEYNDFHAAIPHFLRSFRLDEVCEIALRYLVLAYERAGGPKGAKPGAPTEAEIAAWNAELDAFRKDLEDKKDERKKALDERTALTGDMHGGCQ
jgi:tetratricopeptide (TPR) repeat protein